MKFLLNFYHEHRPVLFVILGALFLLLISGTTVLAQTVIGDAVAATGDMLLYPIAMLFYALALGIGGLIAGFGGLLLDLSISQTVIGMGSLLRSNSDIGVGIQNIWMVIRDIINMLFIFGLIYIGIKTILNSEDSGTKRMLGLLIVAALMINFSLYISQAIVDFSNIAATQIYNQILSANLGNTFSSTAIQTDSGSIAGALFNVAGISSFFGGGDVVKNLSNSQTIVYALMMMIFLIITGIVFLMGAVLLIGRFVALIIYMILSPLMFIGFILPSLYDKSKEWMGGFLKNAFFAPAFLFMLYLSLVVLQRLKALSSFSGGEFSDIIRGGTMTTSHFTIVLFFCLMIGFMYASIRVAQAMGIAGAATSMKMLDSGGKYIRNGAQGYIVRNTVGWGLNKGVGGIDALDRAAENGSRSARVARRLLGGESGRKVVVKARDYGAGGTGRADAEKMNKERSQRAIRSNELTNVSRAIALGATAGVGSAERIAMEKAVRNASSGQILEMVKDSDDKKKIISAAGELSDGQFKAIMDDKEIDDVTKKAIGQARGTQVEARLIAAGVTATNATPAIADIIGKADISELNALGFDKAFANAGKLSAKQIDDWKDLTPTEKTQIKTERKNQLETEFGVNGANAAALFTRIKSDEERSKLPDSILKDAAAAQYLNTNVLTKIVDNNGISDMDRQTIKAAVLAQYPVGHTDRKKYVDFFGKNNAGQRY